MVQVGDQVIYGIHGVCKIVDSEEHIIDRRPVRYLVLEPMGQAGTRFLVPTHNAAAMGKLRKLLSRSELEELIQSEEVHTDAWIKEENLRKQTYRELIGSGDRTALMKMVYSIYRHKNEQTALGKKFHLCDENFLRDAEKLLSSEISMVMGLNSDQARAYIRQQLKAE